MIKSSWNMNTVSRTNCSIRPVASAVYITNYSPVLPLAPIYKQLSFQPTVYQLYPFPICSYATKAKPRRRAVLLRKSRSNPNAHVNDRSQAAQDHASGSSIQGQQQLHAEVKSGRIECALKTAQTLVAKWSGLASVPSKEDVGRVCREHGVSLRIASQVASYLLRPNNVPLHKAGARLLHGTAEAGDPYAILRLVSLALKQGKVDAPQLEQVLLNLTRLARREGKESIPQAEYLVGRIAESHGQRGKAVAAYKRVLNLLGEYNERNKEEAEIAGRTAKEEAYRIEEAMKSYDGALSSSGPVPHASVLLGHLLGQEESSSGKSNIIRDEDTSKYNDSKKAQIQAYADGAHKHDDADAYFYLAQTQSQTLDPLMWAQYMTKAAASGNIPAAYQLGVYYARHAGVGNLPSSPSLSTTTRSGTEMHRTAETSTPPPSSPTTKLNRTTSLITAKHWFAVAAAQEHASSNLGLARVQWERGNGNAAMDALVRIVEDPEIEDEWPEVAQEAQLLLQEWGRDVTAAGARVKPVGAMVDYIGWSRMREMFR